MGDSPKAAIEGLNENGRGIRVAFHKAGDRFRHTIYEVFDGKSLPLLTSVEGGDLDDTPSSPPFSELHQQDEIVFLSGATTSGHWSGSVVIRDMRVHFEIACRLRRSVESLGSLYEIQAAEYAVECCPGTISDHRSHELHISPTIREPLSYPTTAEWSYHAYAATT